MRQETINIYPHPLLEKVCSYVCGMRIISVVLVILDLIFFTNYLYLYHSYSTFDSSRGGKLMIPNYDVFNS
jgi:hypothetical protein